MSLDDLNALVTAAIWRAEELEKLGLDARSAWTEVSHVEEELSNSLPVTDAEGRIARRGAVGAALEAQDQLRAEKLVAQYSAEGGAPKALCAALDKMLAAQAQDLSEQFPFAAKHHKPAEIRNLARQLRRHGPFGLAVA